MPTPSMRLWDLLLSKLSRTDSVWVAWATLLAAGAEPQALIDARLATYAGVSAESVDCECGVEPDLDCSSREGLVGIACVGAPRCFDGWQWVSRFEVEWLRCQARDVFRALASRNGLTPLEVELSRPFVELGVLARRGLQVSVVWMGRSVPSLEELCLGLRQRLGRDGLIVVTPALPRVAFPAAERIVFHELPAGCRGNFGLERALDELTPDYRSRVIESPLLDLDYVRLRFATRPGDRHVVEINGHDFGGFRKSDVKFLRLLLLATARKHGPTDGWLDKSRLRDGDDKDRALERMREELVTYDVPGLSEEERRALVRANKGQLRLGVPAENIELDPSLASLEFIAPTTTVRSNGAKVKATPKQADGLRNAAVLLRDCRRLAYAEQTQEAPW